jgi:serine/threonine protein kinase
MSFLKALFSGKDKNKRKEYKNITKDVDPLEKWTKVSELGDGAFGKVFKAEHRDNGQLAALKIVPIVEETDMEDFMVEIDILSECRHPNIVGLHEAFFFDSQLWMFIEFCSGGSVDDIILELERGLTEPQIKCITKQLFEALAFLHEQRVIHRDLKSGNIFLCSDGTIRLGDFGVSAMLKQREKRFTFIGTQYWMAPEVVACEAIKDEPYNCKADVWSAGMTLIEMADMHPTYHEMNPMRVLTCIARSEPPTLSFPLKWSNDFNSFIAKCLVKSPAQRSTSGDLLNHPFISAVADTLPLRLLYCEMNATVEETIEELPEDISVSKESDSGAEEPGTPPFTPMKNETLHDEGSVPTITVIDDVKDDESTATTTSSSTSISKIEAKLDAPSSSSEGDPPDFHYSTLRRQRTFKVDGKTVTTETTHIIQVSEAKSTQQKLQDNKKYQQMRYLRV